MKRLLLLLAVLALPVAASAQLVQSSSMVKVKERTDCLRHGWSVAATLNGAYMFKDEIANQKMGLGLYADGGYFLNPYIYLGLTAGIHYEDIPDSELDYKDVRTKKIAPQVLLNPRFYLLDAGTSPFLDLRGGISLGGDYWGRLEALLGCVFSNHFEVAAGIANQHYEFGKNIFQNLEFCVRLGYRFYF